MSRIWKKMQGLNGVILCIYLAVVVAISLYYALAGVSGMPGKIKLLLLAAGCVLAVLAAPWIIRGIQKIPLQALRPVSMSRKKRNCFLCGVWLVSFLVLLLWYIGFYPGAIIFDTAEQWQQAVSGSYSDWHPALHTLLSFTLPLKLTNGWAGSVVFFQILLFASVLCYASAVLSRVIHHRIVIGILVFILLNPITGKMSVHPLKDTSLALWGTLLLLFAMQIYYSHGEWLRSIWRKLLFAVVFVIATLVRHNAILLTLPILVCVLLCVKNLRGNLKVLVLIALLTWGVRGPLYSAFDVSAPGARHMETLGCPMTIIGNVVVTHPEVLDEETQEFVYAIADQETWETYYTCGSFNNLKRSGYADLTVIEETDVLSILRMTLRCTLRAPASAAESFLTLTRMVYSLDGNSYFYEILEGPEEFEVEYAGNRALLNGLEAYCKVFYNSFLKYFFCYIGIMDLVVLVCMCGKLNLRNPDDWKRLLACVSVFTYNFGTMLFLTGRDDRFFYVTFLLAPVLTVFALIKEAPSFTEGAVSAPDR
ncbi:MAG: DUF6020 family protein [Lachnospiraceae bacterium]|nr:DUF6020 family protein [Lachnospiraceae bacterium]